MKQVTYALLGYGGRGHLFARLAKAPQMNAKIVAVAEPDPIKRAEAMKDCNLTKDMVFESAEELFAKPRLADGLINTTMDKLHAKTAIPAMKKGYHLFLEKPMAVTLEDCIAIEKTQTESGVMVAICHSLRFHKLFATMKKMIDSGKIGDVITIDHVEAVDNILYSTCFIRGNWNKESNSTFMLMSKSCHDIDIMSYLVDKKCKKVSSFGSLNHFKKENKPEGAPEFCLEGCPVEKECPYQCGRIFLDDPFWRFVFKKRDDESVLKELQSSPYGKCVYQSDNDVVDHQVVNLKYEDGVTGTFTMTAFAQLGGRSTRIHGTKGTIEGNDEENIITYRDFTTGNTSQIDLGVPGGINHDRDDEHVLSNFTNAIRYNDSSRIITNAQESLESHRIVFAAEKARKTEKVVEI